MSIGLTRFMLVANAARLEARPHFGVFSVFSGHPH